MRKRGFVFAKETQMRLVQAFCLFNLHSSFTSLLLISGFYRHDRMCNRLSLVCGKSNVTKLDKSLRYLADSQNCTGQTCVRKKSSAMQGLTSVL